MIQYDILTYMKVSQREILLQLPETELARIASATQTAAQLVLGEYATIPRVHLQYDPPAKRGVLKVGYSPILPDSPINEISDAYVHPLDIVIEAQVALEKNGNKFLDYHIARSEIVAHQVKTCAAIKAVVAIAQALHNDETGTLSTSEFEGDSETIANETFKLLNLNHFSHLRTANPE